MPRNKKRDDARYKSGELFRRMLNARQTVMGKGADQQEWLAWHVGKLVNRVTYLERQVNGKKRKSK